MLAAKVLLGHVTRVSTQSALRPSVQRLLTPSWKPIWTSHAIRFTTTKAVVTDVRQLPNHGRKIVGTWLLGCAGMCFGALVLGGVTRLTESGLSITQWNLLKGMKPPRSEQEWLEEFEQYKQFPEFKYLERELTVEDFKRIFFWEYFHRLWGRSIAIVFLLPAAYFLRKGWITKPMRSRLVIYTGLLAFQGAMGWYMVKSGLAVSDDPNAIPRVSQYRLATHLGSAIVLYALFLWQGLHHIITPQQLVQTASIARLRKYTHGAMAAIFLTAISGAFVAGLDAGLVYNSWPKMADRWIPVDVMAMTPKWKNVFENATTTQFIHRYLGETVGTAIVGLWWLSTRTPLPPRARIAAHALGAMALIQIGLGVATLLTYVDVSVAATHQAGALSLLSFAIWLIHELRHVPK
jgi:cytochrome c oxidase assembly protein subunit 15